MDGSENLLGTFDPLNSTQANLHRLIQIPITDRMITTMAMTLNIYVNV